MFKRREIPHISPRTSVWEVSLDADVRNTRSVTVLTEMTTTVAQRLITGPSKKPFPKMLLHVWICDGFHSKLLLSFVQDFAYDDPKVEFNVDAPNGVVMEGYLFKRASNAFKTWNR